MSARGPLPVDPIAEARRQWIAHGWAPAADGMAAVTSIIRAQQLMMARIDQSLRPFDLSFARFELLRLLAFSRDGRLPTSSAIARLQVHPASISSTVDRLERDGLLTRARHPADGRATILEITPAGRALVERATHALNDDVFPDLGLEPDELTTLTRVIAALRRRSGDFAEPRELPEPL